MKKAIFIIIGIVVVGIAWYGLSPLLKNKTVNDALPENTVVDQKTKSDESVVPLEEEAQEVRRAPVVDTPTHPASGFVRLVQNGDETIVRYEEYKTINGPDVRVYLANDLKASDFVDLGPIKGTEGNINYSVPQGVDISKYRYALTWCEDFAVLFNSADLSLTR
ncbi:MAG: DM13 domain-containing protein [Candidatus Moranbacteria bacterium]|nr:DM13 domain-containing protein [Candidatus Moranbacteria bacterium]